jgi:hypothetical protein
VIRVIVVSCLLIGLWILGWDDDCDGLVRMISWEEEWKEWECQNDAVQWGAEATGWEATPPASPVPRVDAAGVGIWPTTEEHLAWAGTWPSEDELLAEWVSVEVSVEVHTSIGELVEEHTACRLLYIISYRLGFQPDQPFMIQHHQYFLWKLCSIPSFLSRSYQGHRLGWMSYH